jgi:ATP-binding cassette, subfamily B, bacterial
VVTKLHAACFWPCSRTGDLMRQLARRCGLLTEERESPDLPEPSSDREAVAFVEACAGHFALEAEPVRLRYGNAASVLQEAAPMLLRNADGRLLGVMRVEGKQLVVLSRLLDEVRVPVSEVARHLREPLEAEASEELEPLLESMGSNEAQRSALRQGLMEEQLRHRECGMLWQLRNSPGMDFRSQLKDGGCHRMALGLVLGHVAQRALMLAALVIFGVAAFGGRFDQSLLAAWALLLFCVIPLRGMTTWLQGRLAITLAGLFKQRLLAGALRLPMDVVRGRGVGDLAGRAMEAQQLEQAATGPALALVLSMLDLMLGAIPLAFGATPLWHAGLLLVVLLVLWRVLVRLHHAAGVYADRRRVLTGNSVEAMNGQRTRIAQQAPEQWHEQEDQLLQAMEHAARLQDRWTTLCSGALPRFWVVLALSALAVAWRSAAAEESAAVAWSLAGVLLIWQALGRLCAGAAQMAMALQAWRQCEELFDAAARAEEAGSPVAALLSRQHENLLDLRSVGLRHRETGRAALEEATMQVKRGDWVLLEGSSGSGKSTLLEVAGGLRRPTTGIVVASGVDYPTLGARGWRRSVALAPQYHQNHVLAAPLAFNLLMGRNWPPASEDLREAEAVCEELGLGPLLERMPGGLFQMVGDTGWQLSQGERSRVFLARALLQGAPLVVLDESLGALDPAHMKLCLDATLRRSPALLLTAHP